LNLILIYALLLSVSWFQLLSNSILPYLLIIPFSSESHWVTFIPVSAAAAVYLLTVVHCLAASDVTAPALLVLHFPEDTSSPVSATSTVHPLTVVRRSIASDAAAPALPVRPFLGVKVEYHH